jgi:hypothetical protein
MNDFEERLRIWGAAEARAAGQPPSLLSRTPPRRWLPLAAAAAAVVLVGGAALAVSQQDEPARVATTNSDVPWADLPPGTVPDPATSSAPAADPSVRACRSTDLGVSHQGQGEGAGGSWVDSLTLTNTAVTPCRLTGRLEGISGVNAGARRAVTVGPADSLDQAPVVLKPGEAGQLPLLWYPRCDTTPAVGDTTYTHLRIRLLGGELPVPAPYSIDLGCAAPQQGMGSGTLGLNLEPTTIVRPVDSLTVTLVLPATARAGAVLRYVVEVHNPGSVGVALDPCPNFLQALGGNLVKEPHALNCPAAHPVPAFGSERFAMELVVPASAPSGATALSWQFVGLGATATGVVTVEGGTVATATPCTPESTQAPCTPGMEVGRPYPYPLYTHCGIRELYADGRSWVPRPGAQPLDDGSGNPPAEVDNPVDPGTVVLLKPGVTVEWRSRQGVRFTFRPRVPGDPAVQPCD